MASALFAGAPQAWGVGEVVALAWQRFKASPVPLAGATLVYFAISEAVGNIPTVIQLTGAMDPHSGAFQALNLAFTIVNMFLGCWLQVGLVRMWLDCARGNPAKLADLFGGADRMLAMTGSQFVFGLAVAFSMLACFIPAFPVAAGLIFAPFLVVDARMGGMAALSNSWAATKGQRMPLVGLGFVALGLWLLGLALCGVGFLVTYPVSFVALAIVYLRITGRDRPAADAPFAPPAPAPFPAG